VSPWNCISLRPLVTRRKAGVHVAFARASEQWVSAFAGMVNSGSRSCTKSEDCGDIRLMLADNPKKNSQSNWPQPWKTAFLPHGATKNSLSLPALPGCFLAVPVYSLMMLPKGTQRAIVWPILI
jgi:hypothetical protein